MLRNLRRFLFVVSCMIIGLFLFAGDKTSATEARLVDANNVTIGGENKENKYYFSNEDTWEFKIYDVHIIKEWDTLLTWRVINPEGKATKWSGDEVYVDNKNQFTIRDYKSLSYTEVDSEFSTRVSVAPKSTYYVHIKYYGKDLFRKWDQKKDEVIKIVVNDDEILGEPIVSLSYNKTAKILNVGASFAEEGYGIITRLEYAFATEALDIENYTDFKNLKSVSANQGDFDITPSGTVKGTLNIKATDVRVYVVAKSGNGSVSVGYYDFTTDENPSPLPDEDTTPPGTDAPAGDDGNGLFDFDFGELILIVLVIVLIVSCALIIAQKLVDYKKRLY